MSNIIFGRKSRFTLNSSLDKYKCLQTCVASVNFELLAYGKDGDKTIQISFYQAFVCENANFPLCDRSPDTVRSIPTHKSITDLNEFLTGPLLDDWINKDHAKDCLRFQMFDDCGNVLEEIKFSGLIVYFDGNCFDYGDSKESLRKVRLTFDEFNKIHPPAWIEK
jgi:hypothetical protein